MIEEPRLPFDPKTLGMIPLPTGYGRGHGSLGIKRQYRMQMIVHYQSHGDMPVTTGVIVNKTVKQGFSTPVATETIATARERNDADKESTARRDPGRKIMGQVLALRQ